MAQGNLDREEFRRDFALKDHNWFYVGMARIWYSLLMSVIGNLPQITRALDAGCGAGGKAEYLKKAAGEVYCLDLSADALEFSGRDRSLKLARGSVERLPFRDSAFGLISSFDVLEHIDDDEACIREFNRTLAPGGVLILAVPAYRILWSGHDVANYHKRRYVAGELKDKLERSGFAIRRSSYAGFFIFPVVLLCRIIERVFSRAARDPKRTRVEDIPAALNTLLRWVFTLESLLVKHIYLPFGSGLITVAVKTSSPKPVSAFLERELICPDCGNHVGIDSSSGRISGKIVCQGCCRSYPVVSGVPRFINGLSDEKKRTARNFGYSWKAFPGYFDFYREQFLDWIAPVRPEDLAGKIVLDAGCGSGRHAYQAAYFGAREVVGVDLSRAIDVAYVNTMEISNIHLVQADIYRLPLESDFDYIYCIGVLHHLPEPEEGFRSLVKLLKRGGRISVWVYAKEGNSFVRRVIDPIRLHLTSKMPLGLLYALSAPLASILFITAKLVVRPLNSAPALRRFMTLLPLNDYIYSISGFNFYSVFNIVFDQLVAVRTCYISGGEIENWFRRAGLVDVNVSLRNKNGWRGTGVKS